ncbi:MAG: glycosyltransferase family 2 protein [Chloroflexi bacterium]|nr:glycosyltransferase family 2 protein [Anaerolineaceae bacterium]NMB90344.1 glycosyltransferase family 2 protein [Chloroflexota bacterium]
MPEKISSCSIVIPVYNSEQSLPLLVERLAAVLPGICPQYEVLLVNDGSRDGSWEVITRLIQQFPFVRGINLMRNYGQHNALLCGIRNASCQAVVTMDDDLQHPPEEIHKLVERLNEGFDVVYGVPRKLPHSLWRNFFSWLSKRVLAFVMGIRTVREISAFRCFRTRLREAFVDYQSPGVIIDALLSWGTTQFSSILVDEEPRQYGNSNYNFSKLFSQVILILTGFSTVPLRVASWLGFAFMLLGIAVFLFVLISYLTQGSIPGFPFLASIISIFSGSQLFALGIIGEYMARIFDRSMARPSYVIGEITAADLPSAE